MGELNTKLSSEAERADRIAFDNSKLMEKLEALSVERDRLVIERDALRESNEEMKLIQEVPTDYTCQNYHNKVVKHRLLVERKKVLIGSFFYEMFKILDLTITFLYF